MTRSSPEVVVIGAGIGGLATAATLARRGISVTVLEAQPIPGGCASTFYHQGYRFDSGATLAGGFYPGGPMDLLGRAAGIHKWTAIDASPVMLVRTSDGTSIPVTGGPERWEVRRQVFGPESQAFWQWQEHTAEAMWSLALRLPAWPPQTISQIYALISKGFNWLVEDRRNRMDAALLRDGIQSVSAHLGKTNERLKEFIDAQLLISAQTTSRNANALYAAAALDLPRRGVVHLNGGIGAIAETLVQAINHNGGKVQYHQEVQKIILENHLPKAVVTKRGDSIPADLVISNLPPWNTARLLSGEFRSLRNIGVYPPDGWGAYMLYLGVEDSLIPRDFPLHHQVIRGLPMGEGNTIFLSINPDWDTTRAPEGRRAITISTHTSLAPWWDLFEKDRIAYQNRKQDYQAKLLSLADTILPGIHDAAHLVLPGTPVTYQRFTRRARGWVGGFPQTGLFRPVSPYIGRNVWLVGDSIFPGQSCAAVSLGGLRVASDILDRMDLQKNFCLEEPGETKTRESIQLQSDANFNPIPVAIPNTHRERNRTS